MSKFRIIGFAFVFAGLAAAPAHAVPVIFGFGDIPGGALRSDAFAVSADGSTVVGRSRTVTVGSGAGDWEAQRRRNGQVEALGVPSPATRTGARGVSGDGSIVSGTIEANTADLQARREAVRWADDGSLQRLGFLPSDGLHITARSSVASATSRDGNVTVGGSLTTFDLPSPEGRAFRWENGVMQSLGTLPGGGDSSALAVSADGSVVAGNARTASGGVQGFRWTEAAGIEGLAGFDILLEESAALDMNDDGSIIVGSLEKFFPGFIEVVEAAFLWSEELGLIDNICTLPRCGPGSSSRALAVTNDGSTIVGSLDTRAFIWHAGVGMEYLEDYLEDAGLDLGGWHLDHVEDISSNGSVIVGRGRNPAGDFEGWIVVIPEPTTSALLAFGLSALALRRRVRCLQA